MQAIDFENVPDPVGLIAALDEITAILEQVYACEQVAPTPCQLFVGRVFLDAVQELLEGTYED